LLKGERGDVTKGSIELRGERIENLTPADLVNRGVVQVMEGRHCFAHLTIEENLMTGSYTRTDKGEVAANLDKVYTYFPRLKTRRTSQAAYTSGGEQQMCAIGRGLMSAPTLLMIDELSLGLAPVLVEQLIASLIQLNAEGLSIFVVEQDVVTALEVSHTSLVMDQGRIVRHGPSGDLLADPSIRAAYLGELA
jgi:branched-chain amino acid transport system ATP-binding protein